MTTTPESPRPSRGLQDLERGLECWRTTGDYDETTRYLDGAMSWAIEHGDSDLWDRAFCGRCALDMTEHESVGDWLAELRQIVLRSQHRENAFLAAYNVARAYELMHDGERAMFYARIAQDRCQQLRRRDWLAWSKNQLGNLLLAESQFEDACFEYEQALGMMAADASVEERTSVFENLGYCRVIQGRHSEAFGLLFEALRITLRNRLPRFEPRLRLVLCWAYLDIARPRPALRHSLRALELAEENGDSKTVKHAYFLIGETYNQLGHSGQAHEFFVRLQRRFFPTAAHVPDLLMALDVRPLINLKA